MLSNNAIMDPTNTRGIHRNHCNQSSTELLLMQTHYLFGFYLICSSSCLPEGQWIIAV